MLSNSPMKLDDAGKPWLTVSRPCLACHRGAGDCHHCGLLDPWLAVSRPDPVIAEDYYQRGLNINETLKESGRDMTPAMKGRNHAATPLEDQPR